MPISNWLMTAGGYGKLAGATALYGLRGGYGRTIAGAGWGGIAGGLWGAMSDDTSVFGGALMGAGIGAGTARYGGAGWRNMWGAARFRGMNTFGAGMTAFGRGMRRQARADWRMALSQGTAARAYIGGGLNRGYNKFRAMWQ